MSLLLAVVALLLSHNVALAASSDAPRRKAGLWEMKISDAGMGGSHTMQQCIDEKSDDLIKFRATGKESSNCSKTEIRKQGSGYAFESICKVSNSTVTNRGTVKGRLDSEYTIESRATYDPPLSGMRESSTRIDAKWLGACKSGQKAGDVVLPGMPNININELMQKMPKRP